MKKLVAIMGLMTISLFIFGTSSYAENGTIANTLFLWHFDGTYGNATADFAKATNGPIPVAASVQTLATDTYKFGTGSFPADGSGTDLFSIFTNGNWVFNPYEWTVDYWHYTPVDFDGTYRAYGFGVYNASAPFIDLREQHHPQLEVGAQAGAETIYMTVTYSNYTLAAPVGQWNHFARTWSSISNATYVYLNGNVVASTLSGVSALSYAVTTADWQGQKWGVHMMQGFSYAEQAGTRIDELRISDIDRYGGANFTPPLAAYSTPVPVELSNFEIMETESVIKH